MSLWLFQLIQISFLAFVIKKIKKETNWIMWIAPPSQLHLSLLHLNLRGILANDMIFENYRKLNWKSVSEKRFL